MGEAEKHAEVIRATIEHRERMLQNLYVIDDDGAERKVPPDRDILLPALKFALACVEEKIQQKGEPDVI